MIGFILWLLSLSSGGSSSPSPPPPTPTPPAPPAPRPRKPGKTRAQSPRGAAAARKAAAKAQAEQAAAQAAKKARRRARRQAAAAAAAAPPQRRRKPQKRPAAPAPAPRPRKRGKKRTKGVTRAGLVVIPGQYWIPWEPAPADLLQLAQQKLDELWSTGEGTTRVIPLDDGRIVGLLATELDDDERGISIWRLRPGTVIPEGVFPPREELEALAELDEDDEGEDDEGADEAPAVELVDEDDDEPAEVVPLEIVHEDEAPHIVPRPDKPVLMQGSSGPSVVELQQLLGMSGQLGFYGPMTVQRVQAFQRANGLDDDGVTGEMTWGALLA